MYFCSFLLAIVSYLCFLLVENKNIIKQQEIAIATQHSTIDSLQLVLNDSEYHFYNDETKELTYQQVDSILNDYYTLSNDTRFFISDFAQNNVNLILQMNPSGTIRKSNYYKDIDYNRSQAEKLKEYLYY